MDSNAYLEMFAKQTNIVCISIVLAIVLILATLLTPIKNYLLYYRFFYFITIGLIGYALYVNISLAYNCFNDYKNVPDQLKSNLTCSCFFTLFIVFLLITMCIS